jgi:hypothetical protein
MWYPDHLLKGKRHKFYKNLQWAMKPYPKQQEVVDYLWGNKRNPEGGKYRFFLAVFGRQSGKSFLARYVSMRRAIEFSHRVMWIAPTNKNAREHWSELKDTILNSGIPYKHIREQGKEIIFHGGGFIRVRSALEGDGLRGGTMDLIVLDEAAFFQDGKYLYYSVILPMITASGGQILFTTTPNGRNYVYDLFRAGQDDRDMLHISWHMKSVDSPYQDVALLKAIKRTMPNMQWLEEFEAEFLSDSGGVWAGVDRASVVPIQYKPAKHGVYSMGVDWGDVKDFTVVTVINILTGEQVFGSRFTGIGTKYQLGRVLDLIYTWQPDHVYVERNGMGQTYYKLLLETIRGIIPIDQLFEQIANSGEEEYDYDEFSWWDKDRGKIDKKVTLHGVHLDNKQKRELVESASAHVEYGRLKLLTEASPDPDDYCTVQKAEMSTYERKRTANGVQVTYGASDDNHDDTVSALILAAKGLPQPEKIQRQATDLSVEDIKKQAGNPFRKAAGKRINKRRRA